MKKSLPFLLFLLLLCAGCGNAAETESRTVYAMDTVMTLTAYVPENLPHAVDQGLPMAEEEIHRLDALLSISRENSDIYRLNQDKAADISDETADLLRRAIEISEATGGAFDPTVYPLMELWGFSGDTQRVPEDKEIQQALTQVGTRYISELYSRKNNVSHVTLSPQCSLDFGGIAKGYTAQMVLDTLETAGIESAVISLGGNVGLMGTKPDGSDWTVAVENPDGSGGAIATLSLSGGERTYVVTSGGYQRYFEENGVRYHHIINPKTGYPAETDLRSVTVVSHNGTQADALSTALFVMGFQQAVDFWRSQVYDFDMVLVTDSGVYVTPGLTVANGQQITPLEDTP